MALLPKLTPYMCNIRQLSLSSCYLKSVGEVEIPKRPLTPWSSYYTSNYPDVKARNPTLRSPEIMRILSGNWKDVSEMEKQRLHALYMEEKKKYRAIMDELPEEVIKKAKEEKKEKREEKKEKILNRKSSAAASDLLKVYEELNKPKKNLSAYISFSVDHRRNLPDSMKAADKIKIIAQAWNELSEAARTKYEKKAAKDRERYIQEMGVWQAKIKEDGSVEQISELKKLKSKKK